MVTQEEINKASQEYADSLALPQWDNKDIHAIDFQNGVAWALAQMASTRERFIEEATDFIKSKLQGKCIEWNDEYCWNLDMFLRLFKDKMSK